MKHHARAFLKCFAAAYFLLCPFELLAQPAMVDKSWPERPVRLIVPFQPGSSSDAIARIVGQRLSERLGKQVVVDNRVGASSMLGTEAVARAEPDGYTIGLANTTTHASATALSAKPTYDPINDFAPVVMIGNSPFVILASPQLSQKTLQGVIALARAKPGTLTYASAGPATMSHLTGALLEKMAGIKMVHVPYRGSAQSVVDLMEGRIDLLMGTIAPTVTHIRNKKMIALATTGSVRNDLLPDVPTVAESGLAGYEASLWTALVMPAKTPPAIVSRLNQLVVELLNSPDVRESLLKQGVDVTSSTPDELREYIRNDLARWTEIIREAGLKN